MKIGRSEGGQGGKLGHSQMSHWTDTDDVKQLARVLRRRIDKILERKAKEDRGNE